MSDNNRRSLLLRLQKPNYKIITADTNCETAAQVQAWLTSIGVWGNKYIHLNKTNHDINYLFFAYNPSSNFYTQYRIQNKAMNYFYWQSDYTCYVYFGDEYLVYDSLEELESFGLIKLSDISQFQFESCSMNKSTSLAECQTGKWWMDMNFIGSGVLANTNTSRTSAYDATSITFEDGVSTAATRYSTAPVWGNLKYTFNTYPDDIWTVQSGSFKKIEQSYAIQNFYGIGLTKINKPYKLITADTDCTTAAQVQAWLTSKGYTNIHLNSPVGDIQDNQFWSFNDFINGNIYPFKVNTTSGSVETFTTWGSDIPCVINQGDTYLVFSKMSDLVDMDLIKKEELLDRFRFTTSITTTQNAKTVIESMFTEPNLNAILINTSASIRITTYDAYAALIVNGLSVAGDRYNSSTPAPIWNDVNYSFNTKSSDVWEAYRAKVSGRFSLINGLGLRQADV